MPKSTKKKREKAADFTKPKLKLGKKQTPANVVDTSFKARSITLPNQSITVDKSDNTPTTKRKLTVEDLIVHLRHYNATTRKDAILGLRELLEAHWSLLQTHLVALLDGLMRIVNDENASVRKTLTSFLAWLLPRIPPEELVPHSSLLLLYTTSAQTHIFPDIRIDAIRVLDILLECIPGSVTAGWCQVNGGHGNRVLDGYLGILNARTVQDESEEYTHAIPNTTVVLSPASKLMVLKSLSDFLRVGLSSSHPRGITFQDVPEASSFWFFSDTFKNAEAFFAFDSLLRPSTEIRDHETSNARVWSAEAHLDDDFILFPGVAGFTEGRSWAMEELTDECCSLDRVADDKMADTIDYDYLTRLARNLQSILVSTFLDNAPNAFSPSGGVSETSLHLVLAISQIAQSIHSTLLQHRSVLSSVTPSSTLEDLGALLGYMAPYFPFMSCNKADVKVDMAINDLNIICCELAALHEFAMDSQWHRRTRHKRQFQSEVATDVRISAVSDHIVHLLRGESLSSSQLTRPLTAGAYLALMPAIWFLLNSQTLNLAEQRRDIFNAVIDHGVKTLSKSATKRTSLEFISRLSLLDTDTKYQGNFGLGRSAEMDNKFEGWILHLPQCLWELGATNFPMTEVILRVLLRLLQRRSRHMHAKAARILVSKLVPYFSIDHAVRGQLPGPYTKLPSPSILRRLALDIAVTLLMTHPSGLADDVTRLLVAINLVVTDTQEQNYWDHIKLM